jgi:hypothetical protein
MATVTETSTGQDSHPQSSESDVAVRRVTFYFHSLGLPLEPAAQAAERIAREIHADQEIAHEPNECAGRATDRAMDCVDEWLSRLAESYPDAGDDLSAQLKWHLRPVLREHPECFLRTQDLPDAVHRALRKAAQPILPPSLPAVMPAQSFGDLPRLGHRIVAYAGLIGRRLVGALPRIRRRAG